MKYFCTVSDINYINQGLALYQSLVENMTEDFCLCYICIGDEICSKLASLYLPNLRFSDANNNPKLQNISETSRQGYAWELAARSCKFLIGCIGIDHIMYIDSDIITYPGFEKVYDEIGDKSIAIVPHLHLQPAPCVVAPGYPGGYNVGIIYFKNDEAGKGCLDLWAYAVLNPYDNEIRTGTNGDKYNIKLHNTCGDQRFLEMFPVAYPNDTHIIGTDIAHGAPWNMHVFNLDEFDIENRIVKIDDNGRRDWMKEMIPNIFDPKPMVYYHFAGFKPDYVNDTYAATREAFNQDFMNNKAAQLLHDEYYQKMKTIKEMYDL